MPNGNIKTAPANSEQKSNNRSALIILAILSIVLFWVYLPTFVALVKRWSTDDQYSHGFLVPAFSLVLLWLNRDRLKNLTPAFSWWGIGLLLFGGLLRITALFLYFDWLDAFSLLPCLAGIAVLLGGRKAFFASFWAIVFLGFMIPLPFTIQVAAGFPLQRIATISSTYLLQTIGLPALAEGNTILLHEHHLGVVEACNGLSMMLVFFALSTAVALLIRRPLWEKLVVVVSAIPIAILSNVIRITVTGVLYETAGSEVAEYVFHDLAGWLMMPLALGFLWLELKALSLLFVEVEEIKTKKVAPVVSATSEGKETVGASASPSKAKKKAQKNAAVKAGLINTKN